MINIRTLALHIILLTAMFFSFTGCRTITRTVGMILPLALKMAPLKLMFLCIPEGTPVDTPEGPRPIQLIRPGDNVIGYDGHTVRVLQVHGYHEDSTVKRFLQINFENGASVRLCDMHRINGIRGKHVKPGDVIDKHTVKSIDIYDGVERSYDLLTEDKGYRISGLPVNSMIEEMLEAGRIGPQSICD